MNILRTTTCIEHRHPEFRVSYDPTIVHVNEDAEWLVNWLAQSVAAGTRFAPGETCQIGWSMLEFRQTEDGELSLWEPDMRSMPVVWGEGVSSTLAHLRIQKDVVESVLDADDIAFPSMCHSVLICTRLARSAGIIMERADSAGTDSGWFFGCRANDHDHNNAAELLRVSIFEAVVNHAPTVVPYLALPPGSLLGIGTSAPIMFLHGVPLVCKPGSILAMHHSSE